MTHAVVTALLIITVSGLARADQCAFVTPEQGTRALQYAREGTMMAEYCEPCRTKVPPVLRAITAAKVRPNSSGEGQVEVVLNGAPIDLAYVYVENPKGNFRNLASLAGCPTSGVSATLVPQQQAAAQSVESSSETKAPRPDEPTVPSGSAIKCSSEEECVAVNTIVLRPPPPGTSTDVLGTGLDETFSERDAEGNEYRVLPPNVLEVIDDRIDSSYEQLDDEMSWKINASYLGLSAGARRQTERRSMLLRAYHIAKVVKLQPGEKRIGAAKLIAERLYYGWIINWIVEGDSSTLTAEAAAKIASFGPEAKLVTSNSHLRVTTRAIGLKTDPSNPISIARDPEELKKDFSLSSAQPILIEYRVIKPFKVKKLWRQPVLQTSIHLQEGDVHGYPFKLGTATHLRLAVTARPKNINLVIVDEAQWEMCGENVKDLLREEVNFDRKLFKKSRIDIQESLTLPPGSWRLVVQRPDDSLIMGDDTDVSINVAVD